MTLPDPGPNPPEECWYLHEWLEPDPPEPPPYAPVLEELLATLPEPQGIGGLAPRRQFRFRNEADTLAAS